MRSMIPAHSAIREFDAKRLADFVADGIEALSEDEVLAVLANGFCNARMLQQIAQSPRLTSFYAVRRRLVAHRATPLAHALKFVHYLFWSDLLRLSTDVRIAAAVRRAIDVSLINRISKLTLGEKLTTARSCSREVAKALFNDPSQRVFGALLDNSRIVEDDILRTMASESCGAEKLVLIGQHRRWSHRIPIRRALVLHPETPRALAASQLRYLARVERAKMLTNPSVSVYLKRCIERLAGDQIREAEADGVTLQ